jgi:hypothetical protein
LDIQVLKAKLRELVDRDWNLPEVEARYRKLVEEGLPRRTLSNDEIIARKGEFLDRVQRRAEEYGYLSHSCPKGSALALFEQFGIGNLDVIRTLSPFPGLGMTGWTCGGVTGGLIAIGAYFGSDDMLDYGANGRAFTAARIFLPRFEAEMGSILCPRIHEDVVFGKYIDTRSSQESFEEFVKADGYIKCTLPMGIGARLAAEVIIESMEEEIKTP